MLFIGLGGVRGKQGCVLVQCLRAIGDGDYQSPDKGDDLNARGEHDVWPVDSQPKLRWFGKRAGLCWL